jgi:uncharacterized protein (DUF58 family)
MTSSREFHYRLRSSVRGYRPGSHPGLAAGTGQNFAAHARLLDSPDPRRIDIRASLRDVGKDWLVRTFTQRSTISVYAVVDVSRSMHFGAIRPKLDVAADLVESLGFSAHRAGDAVGMLAFDECQRTDLYVPPRHSRGMGVEMAARLRVCRPSDATKSPGANPLLALRQTFEQLAGKRALVFLISDFHWRIGDIGPALDGVSQASLVPVVVWDAAEAEPPVRDGLLTVTDSESATRRAIWIDVSTRSAWRRNLEERRAHIAATFADRGVRPYYVQGDFDPEGLTQYFLEEMV